MSRPQAILFDLGNVLFEIDIPKCSENIYGLLDPQIDKQAFRENFKLKNEALETGELSKAVFINFILSHAKRGIQALDVILAWNSMLVGMPKDHFELLQRLRKKYKLYLLSNINAFHHPRFLEMVAEDHDITHFDTFFDQCFYSHLIGHRKPDHSAFQHVLDQINIDPQAILYLDDTKGHLESAKTLGFQTKEVKSIRQTREIGEWLLI